MWTISADHARVGAHVVTRPRPDKGENMFIRTRLSMTGMVLLVGAVTTACGGSGAGGGGAPTDASEKDFCQTQTSLFEDLLPDDLTDPEVPTDEEMARAVQDWGTKLEEVGTPDGIPANARKGFEAIVAEAGDIDASDFSIDSLEQLEQGGADASAEEKAQAQAFSDYLTETCGDPMDDLELPQLPGSTE